MTSSRPSGKTVSMEIVMVMLRVEVEPLLKRLSGQNLEVLLEEMEREGFQPDCWEQEQSKVKRTARRGDEGLEDDEEVSEGEEDVALLLQIPSRASLMRKSQAMLNVRQGFSSSKHGRRRH